MSENVVGIHDQEPHITVWALCGACMHRWIAACHIQAPLLQLECPKCGEAKSFPSVIPAEFGKIHGADIGHL